ncbi:transposase [Pullulanibacillus sp. KACC 23026]|uniref:transposase n=1 Tax=Pullulanibacillus sp. KACC 23026 TaxID=3028315 RepID=UPI0023AF3E49|nr:transposase [Pullulanibacillus sp. KACC 23026]WEG14407.1 transposase [Pullulanibacillus sp. KACC 23026]
MRELTNLDEIHESFLHRKLEKIPLDLIKNLCLRSMEQVSFHHQKEIPFPKIGKLNLVDASEISLPKKAGEWAYVQKDKNSIKVHMSYCLINSQSAYPEKFILSTGAVSDKEGVDYLVIDKDTTYVFDRGYIKYKNFYIWVKEGYLFVARVNANSKVKVLDELPVPEKAVGILRDCEAEINVPKTCKLFAKLMGVALVFALHGD